MKRRYCESVGLININSTLIHAGVFKSLNINIAFTLTLIPAQQVKYSTVLGIFLWTKIEQQESFKIPMDAVLVNEKSHSVGGKYFAWEMIISYIL